MFEDRIDMNNSVFDESDSGDNLPRSFLQEKSSSVDTSRGSVLSSISASPPPPRDRRKDTIVEVRALSPGPLNNIIRPIFIDILQTQKQLSVLEKKPSKRPIEDKNQSEVILSSSSFLPKKPKHQALVDLNLLPFPFQSFQPPIGTSRQVRKHRETPKCPGCVEPCGTVSPRQRTHRSEPKVEIKIPKEIVLAFREKCAENTLRQPTSLETLALMFGKKISSGYSVTHLLLPDQMSAPHQVEQTDLGNEQCVEFIELHPELSLVGTIHTHPHRKMSVAPSSVDLHNHLNYQTTFPSFITLILNPLDNTYNGWTLTQSGLDALPECRILDGERILDNPMDFHPHPNNGIDYYEHSQNLRITRTLKAVHITDWRS